MESESSYNCKSLKSQRRFLNCNCRRSTWNKILTVVVIAALTAMTLVLSGIRISTVITMSSLRQQWSVESDHPVPTTQRRENGRKADHSATSGPFDVSNPKFRDLLNMTNYKFLSNYWATCTSAAKVFLVLVQSPQENLEKRKIIRKTWGSLQPVPEEWTVQVIFFSGLFEGQSKITHDSQLDDEIKEFGDIVVASFVDSPRNASLKGLVSFKWVLTYCPNADFVMMVNDNVYVDTHRFIRYREEDAGALKPNLYCAFNPGMEPQRDKTSGYFVDFSEFPGSRYPDYCSGLGFGMTVDLIQKLYSMHGEVRYLWISDVYLTGVLMKKAQIRYRRKMRVTRRELWDKDVTSDEAEYKAACDASIKTGSYPTERTFKSIVYIAGGDQEESYMTCLHKVVRAEILKENNTKYHDSSNL